MPVVVADSLWGFVSAVQAALPGGQHSNAQTSGICRPHLLMALTVYEEQLIHKSTTGAWRHVVALWGMQTWLL